MVRTTLYENLSPYSTGPVSVDALFSGRNTLAAPSEALSASVSMKKHAFSQHASILTRAALYTITVRLVLF